jgi:putative transposase
VTAADRRETVVFMTERRISQRRACRLAGISRSGARYRSRERGDAELVARLQAIAKARPRFGYRRAAKLLERDGWHVNHKRVHRLWVQAGLSLPARRPKKKRPRTGAVPMTSAHPGHVWTYDFLEDRTTDARKLRFLTVIDEFTRECLAIQVRRSCPAVAVVAVLEALFAAHGAPEFIRSDNGPEFVAQALREWLTARGAATLYIDPASPWQNAFGESFNGRFRDECLNLELFVGVVEAAVIAEHWRRDYNLLRPHSSLGYQTPAEFKAAWRAGGAGALPPHPRDLALWRPPDGQEKGQSREPCPSVRPPTAALGSLPSVALSSAQAVPV